MKTTVTKSTNLLKKYIKEKYNMKTSAKTIIGFINSTLKGYKLVLGDLNEKRAHKIISSIIGDMQIHDQTTKDVLKYLKETYNYKA